MTNTRRPDRAFIGTTALVFVASTAVTIAWCSSMSAMPVMEMPGGWTMSMTWMRMPGQSWSGAAASFLGMWTVMMIAMMLPVLAPALSRYRASLHTHSQRNTRTATIAAGYFTVWTLFGAAAYPLGVAFAEAAMRVPGLSRAVPLANALVMLIAGAWQLTAWKSRQLTCCREAAHCCGDRGASAWRTGVRLGMRCVSCCLAPTAALLVIGVMDLRAMALVAIAVCAERLAPTGDHIARVIGVVLIATGLFLILQARI